MPPKKRQLVVKQPSPAAEVPDEDHQETRTKRVTRASMGKGKKKAADEVKGASSDVEDSTTPSPKRKRTDKPEEKGQGVKQSRIRTMTSFQSLPLDILVEMARYLDPLSLLELSRVNKAVHATLAHRNAIPLWRLARMNVDLPDLGATDLTEMQYAALMLDNTCSFCGETGKRADYSLRRRWCKDCQKAQLLKASAIEEKVGFTHEATFKVTFATHHSAGGNETKTAYYCKRDVLAVNKQLWALQGSITSAQGRGERFAAFDAMRRYVEERIRNVKAAKEDAVVLAKWQKSSSESRRKAGEAARVARQKAIVERLVDLGYEERDCTAWHLSNISHLVDQPRILTDLIFKRIAPALVEHVERRKAARLEVQTLARLKQLDRDLQLRYMALPKGDASTFPLFAQLVHLPQVQQFWKTEQPLPLDDASWTAVQPALDEDIDKARRAIKLDYARRIVAALQSVGATVSDDVAAALAVPALPPSDLKRIALHDPDVPGSWSLSQRPLDLEHLAPSLSDADLATLFAHPAALFTCTRYMCCRLVPYPDIHEHLVNEQSLCSATGAGGSAASAVLSSSLVREIVRFMHADSPSEGDEAGVGGGGRAQQTVQELEKRGAVFKCGLCSGKAWPSYLLAEESASELTWSEMLKHLTTYHFDLRTHELETPISGKALIQLCKIEKKETKMDDDELLAVASHEEKDEA